MNNTNDTKSSEKPKKSLKKQVESVQNLDNSSDFELWKFYEERADRLSERLWNTGIWLMTILAAILTTPFAANFVVPTEKFPFLVVMKMRLTTGLIAIIGMLFCIYAYFALKNMRDHIKRNWDKAKILENAEQAENTERKNYDWIVLLCVGSVPFGCFLLLLILAIWNPLSCNG